MANQQTSAIKSIYLERYAHPGPLIPDAPHPELDLIVTIPCYNEKNLIASLESLRACDVTDVCAEVIVVVNESVTAEDQISLQNQATYMEAMEWSETHSSKSLKFHILYVNDLPKKHAGVGLARKIAMDEAVRRLHEITNPDAAIVCFDADSLCEPCYLRSIKEFFDTNPQSPGCSIYFEHPLEGNYSQEIYTAIADYELFLRYYVNALRYAGFPYAFETIGSSMAVRSSAYEKQGGMNRRKAGEDFYFLHKIIPMGHFGEINNTKVIPSPRTSDRVPFGTGKAVNEWLENRKLMTYDTKTFEDLKAFLGQADNFYNISKNEIEDMLEQLPLSISHFLKQNNFYDELTRINRSANTLKTFNKHFFQWFDGFKVLKYVHFSRDHYYSNIPVNKAANDLLHLTASDKGAYPTTELLDIYRKRDRNHAVPLA